MDKHAARSRAGTAIWLSLAALLYCASYMAATHSVPELQSQHARRIAAAQTAALPARDAAARVQPGWDCGYLAGYRYYGDYSNRDCAARELY